MTHEELFAVVDQHFAFETPELIERVCETFSDEVVWEAPARELILTNHDDIVSHYKEITSGMKDPVDIECLRRFAAGDEVFDDRIVYFTAGENNVWHVPAGKRVKLRLTHYFKIRNKKICHEIGYEIWKVVD